MSQLQTAGNSTNPPKCVVLVDDDVQIAEAMELMLSLNGVRASLYDSAESLLSCVTMQQGRLQLLTPDGDVFELSAAVLDLNLPGMNGIDLVLHLRAMQPDLKIVLITAALESVVRLHRKELEGVQCLFKQFDVNSLESALFRS